MHEQVRDEAQRDRRDHDGEDDDESAHVTAIPGAAAANQRSSRRTSAAAAANQRSSRRTSAAVRPKACAPRPRPERGAKYSRMVRVGGARRHGVAPGIVAAEQLGCAGKHLHGSGPHRRASAPRGRAKHRPPGCVETNMRFRTAILTLVPLAAVVATATSAAKPPGNQHNLTIDAKPNPVVFGHATVISGKLTGQGHANKMVKLSAAPFPYTNFSNAGTDATDAQGDYSFSQTPQRNTRYQVSQGNTKSAFETVLVRIRTSLKLSDRTPEAGTRVRFSGKACPQHDGALVKIQRRTQTKEWRTLRRTHLLESPTDCSTYRKRLRPRHDGTFRVVVVSGDANYANGIS